jgi:thiol-disulfide isomerase/thioredoxin/protocatechuate 3,4-dioxygenase beta subunit
MARGRPQSAGATVSGATITASIWTKQKNFKATREYQTDAAGAVHVELPQTFYIVRLWAGREGFVRLFAHWEQAELEGGQTLPAEFTFRLERGVSAGGRVVDEAGKPIAGATVQVSVAQSPPLDRGSGRTRYVLDATASTDAEGKWTIPQAPAHPDVEFDLRISHPDYVSGRYAQDSLKAAGVTTAMLHEKTASLTLKSGVIVRGRITDSSGEPIEGALVVHGQGSQPDAPRTDADGRYRLPALAPRVTNLTVIAPGHAPRTVRINLEPGLPEQNFRLEPGRTIRLRIVDASGKPVPYAVVRPTDWKGNRTLENLSYSKIDTRIPRKADADGVWEWTWAPHDPVMLEIDQAKFAPVELEIANGASEHTVVLKAEHRVTGQVTDAATSRPIPNFRVIPVDVFRKDWLHAERRNAEIGKSGRLDYLAWRTDIPIRLRIEAKGYRTQDGPEFRVGDDASRVQNFELQPSPAVVGTVLDSDGRPAAGVDVLLATPTNPAEINTRDSNSQQTATDNAGRFEFPDPGEPFAVIARGDSGFGFAEFPLDHHDLGTIRLQRWASIRGQFHDGGQPVAGARLLLDAVRLEGPEQPKVDFDMQTLTGPDGRFEFSRVPPLPVHVRALIGPWEDPGFRSGPQVPLDLKPGEPAELKLGSGGATVTGRVKLTGPVPADLDCNFSINYLVRRAPGIAPPEHVAQLGFDIRNGWQPAWLKSREGLAYLNTLQSWFVKLASDGSFRISGVPPGEYDLAIEIYAKPSGCLIDPLAREVVRVSVTAADVTRGTLALPAIEATVKPVLTVGDTPALAFERADGGTGSLVDFRGRYTLVHFWASWCEPCKKELPTVQQLHAQYAARGLNVVGISLDESKPAWQAALKKFDLPGKQGRLDGANDTGVSSVPVYWLLDSAGKIVAKSQAIDDLDALIDDRLR